MTRATEAGTGVGCTSPGRLLGAGLMGSPVRNTRRAHVASARLRMRTRFKAAAVNTNIHPTRSFPLSRVLHIKPIVFTQPKQSSTRLRLHWLIP